MYTARRVHTSRRKRPTADTRASELQTQTRAVTPEAVTPEAVVVVVVVAAPPLRPVFSFSVCVPGARVGGAAVAAGPAVEPLRTPFQMQEHSSDQDMQEQQLSICSDSS